MTLLTGLPVAMLFGLCFGSFANVVIHRLPREESVVTPRSRCPKCGRVLGALELVPVLSWLLLGRKCRGCGWSIPARYALVEMLCAIVLGVMWLRFAPAGDFLSFGIFALLGVTLVVVLFIDLDHRIIPNEITYSGFVLALLFALFPHYPWADQTVHLAGLWSGVLGALVGGGLTLAIYEVGYRLYGQEVFGMGDVKLMFMLGALLGWELALLTLFLSFCYGAFFGVGMIALKIASLKSMIPFGPYIVFAAFTTIIAGPEVIIGYRRFMEM